MRVSLFALLVLAVVACAPNPRLTQLDSTARAPRALEHVQVYAEAPERPYTIIALWSANDETPFGRDRRALHRKAVTVAAALGADAVILSMEEDLGLPVRLPSMLPGVAQEVGELTVFTDVTKIHAQLIVWR